MWREKLGCSQIFIGGSDLGASIALLVIESKSGAASGGSFAGAVAGTFDLLCSGVILIDPFVGWKRRIGFVPIDSGELHLKERLMRMISCESHDSIREWFPVFSHSFVCPPIFMVCSNEGLWEREQVSFAAQCNTSRFGNEVVLKEYAIMQTPTGSWLRGWNSTEVESALRDAENWIAEKSATSRHPTATPVNSQVRSSRNSFHPITPSRHNQPGRSQLYPVGSDDEELMFSTISGEDIHGMGEAYLRRRDLQRVPWASSAAEESVNVFNNLNSIPQIDSYSSIDDDG